jgi:fumarate reductase subunit D
MVFQRIALAVVLLAVAITLVAGWADADAASGVATDALSGSTWLLLLLVVIGFARNTGRRY